MPEGVIGGMLGDEGERQEIEALQSEASAEGFAAAIVHQAAMEDPEVAREAAAYLRVQTQHLKDEHHLRLSQLHNQLRSQRMRLSLQILLGLFAVVIAVGAVVIVRDALSSHSVVIDPFETPPALAAGGVSGKTVASGLLDVLTKIQAAVRGDVVRRSLSNAWTNDIEIEVPETGLSVGQIERALKSRFGHDQHIVGDLVQTANGGLTLTVRGNGIVASSFTGTSTELDKLVTEAGEYVYSQSQPGLWMAYLANHRRSDEAIKFAQSSYVTVPAGERPYVLNNWANAIASKGGGVAAMREALPLYRESIQLKPDYWPGYNNVMYALAGIGDEEGVVHVGEQLKQVAGGRPGRAPESTYVNYDPMVWDLPTERAETIADIDSHGGVGSTSMITGSENLVVAQLDAQMHNPDAAELRLKTSPLDTKSMPDVASAAFDRALIAEEHSDSKMAAQEWDKFAVAYADTQVSTSNPQLICFAAVSYQKTGQSKKADTALNAVGSLTLVDCYRFRADVLDLRNNWPEAQQWYAKAIKLAPSIPSGYYSWGMALMRHGDLQGAAVQFAMANKVGPHWADPLKAWGDVLMKQGKTQEAQAKYAEALKNAPNWKELKEAIKAGSKS